MAKTLPRTLNLLQPTERPVSSWDKIYHWVFSVGRYVIIAVELVVLVMFGMRFVLDRRNADLERELDVKVQMLDAQKETEDDLRGVQATLQNLDQMVEEQDFLSPQLETILDIVPSAVMVESFGISQRSITMSCRAPDYEVVKEFETALREESSYDKVNVDLSKTGTEESEVTFELTVYFVEET